jgi:hypothetical protein
MTGHYQFRLFGATPIDDTDRVTLRLAADTNAFVTVFGVGGDRLVSSRWGVRSDFRVHLSANSARLLLDAAPERVLVPGAGFVLVSPGDPGLIFNGLERGGPRSTFGGPPVEDFVTFEGSGMQRHVKVTAGLFVRF